MAWQVKRLTVADFAADPTPQLGGRSLLSPEGLPSTLAPPGPDEAPPLAGPLPDEHGWPIPAIPLPEGLADGAGDGVVTPTGPSDEVSLDEAARLAMEPDEKPHGFIVSIAKGGLHRRLHFYMACFRLPGVHYKNFRILGELMPSEYDMDSKCLDCLPGEKFETEGYKETKTQFVDSEEETLSTASSSSEAEAGPPPRRARRQ